MDMALTTSIALKDETVDRLHISIQPSANLWAVVIAITSAVSGLILMLFGLWCMIFCITCASVFFLYFLEMCQDVIFDKVMHKVTITKQNLVQKYTSDPRSLVTDSIDIDDILLVKYEFNNIVITLMNRNKVDLFGLLIENTDECIRLVEKIHSFLQLDLKHAQVGTPLSETGTLAASEFPNEDDLSATSDDSFEKIDSADLAEYESENQDQEIESDIPYETTASEPEQESLLAADLMTLTLTAVQQASIPTQAESSVVSDDQLHEVGTHPVTLGSALLR